MSALPTREGCCSEAYWCPASGDTECARHGGFNICCDAPDQHVWLRTDWRARFRRWLPFLAAHWYAEDAGAIYIGRWSFHWEVDRYKPYTSERGFERVEGRPRRRISIYRGLRRPIDVRLWKLRSYCEHGYKNTREFVPADAEAFAAEVGLGWMLDRYYGERRATA